MSSISKPYTFVNYTQTADATQIDADFDVLYAWANGNVDNINIGPNGIYASQIIPQSFAQATFGGVVPYTFPGALNVSGTLTANVLSGSGAGLSGIPGSALAHGDYVDAGNAQTIAGLKTFSANVTAPSFVTGTSIYGANGATVNGPTASTGAVGNVAFQFPNASLNAGSTHQTALYASSAAIIASVSGNLLVLGDQGFGAVVAVDYAGDVGANSYFAQSTLGFAGGPTITSGNGVPGTMQPSGSLFLRRDGAVGTRLYVSAGGGSWAAVSGV